MTTVAPHLGRRTWPAALVAALRAAPVGQATIPFYLLFGLIVTLNAVGLVMVLSVSSVTSLYVGQSTWFTFQRQLVWSMGGLVALLVMMRVNYRQWQRCANGLVVLTMVLLVAVLIPGIGTTANGATRWIYFGPLSFQPSELAKLAMALFAASWLADRVGDKAGAERDTRTTIRPVLVVCSLMAGFILLQPNLGTAVIIVMVAFAALFMAGVPLLPLTGWSLLSGGAAALAAWGSGYRRDRVVSMLDPWSDPLDSGWQTIQSRVGIASGGASGVGLGESRIKWGFLPEAQTDFVFAVLAEEMGWMGAMFVICLFAGFVFCGIWVALNAPDRFGQVLAAAITVWVGAQAFVNIAAVVGVLPITGVPLPFLSVGGSALLSAMVATGVLLNIARQIRVEP
ncbi:putative lipid II flippase FtsW [Candidatus Poriferisocius sp.]|uniref:putative lipid II flippase FtsW n=1 Tax=Candidatus Poriferisocius sp. TaxID=3101276 RepID=UPI003B5CFF0F